MWSNYEGAGQKDLRAIYGAATLNEAEQALEQFSERWDDRYPAISPSWRSDWGRLTVMSDYPPAIRKAIYTTNAIESLNYSMRKALQNRGAFPSDESIMKIFYLALNNVAKKWVMPIRDWRARAEPVRVDVWRSSPSVKLLVTQKI